MSDEEEIWKIYPKLDSIEVSNLGRVRTKSRIVTRKNGRKYHVKGRILKQQLLPNGYLFVHTTVNGKGVNLRVNRLVAICFIPNPNNYPEVNHIDNDKTNNVASNLEWCTKQYNLDYKKNFGTSPAEIQGRPVFAVNLKTGKVLRFETQSEAARKLSIDISNVSMVVKGKRLQTGGYWFTEDESEITDEKIQEIVTSMRFLGSIVAINLANFEVRYFESQCEAARQLGANQGSISDVINGKLNKTHGFWFVNIDENTVEKVRLRFGDKIARKVEKLISENKKVSKSC